MSNLVPNLEALLNELPAESPARQLAGAFVVESDLAAVKVRLRAVVTRWLQEEEEREGGSAVPKA